MKNDVDSTNHLGDLSYEDFRRLALDSSLSLHEKVGFPDYYRAHKGNEIFSDISMKLPALDRGSSTIVDIGCGCSDLPRLMITRAIEAKQSLFLIDSAEMLNLLPEIEPPVEKVVAKYPSCQDLLERLDGRADAILIYSVIQYVFGEGNVFEFLDKTLNLLAPNGRLLIGDIPNVSMRKRFFASESGVRHHQEFTKSNDTPEVRFNHIEPGKIDDAVVLALVGRARAAGFHAYVIPQAGNLPMATRREDVLIVRP